MKYTTIGDVVNTAARLESYGKEVASPDDPPEDAKILVAGETVERLGDAYEAEEVGRLSLKGKSQVVTAYRVRARPADASASSGANSNTRSGAVSGAPLD